MDVYVTWGHGNPIKCPVQEIVPEGSLLLSQVQYRPNLITGKLDVVKVPSPPIGMIKILDDSLHANMAFRHEGNGG